MSPPPRPNPLIDWLPWSGKRRTLRRYMRLLPRRLLADYGHRGPYTPAQVEASIARHKVGSPRWSAFAVALFCNREHLRRLRIADPEAHDHEALRRELGETFFGGDAGFAWADVAREASAREAAHGAHGSEGGGHHAGEAHGGGHH